MGMIDQRSEGLREHASLPRPLHLRERGGIVCGKGAEHVACEIDRREREHLPAHATHVENLIRLLQLSGLECGLVEPPLQAVNQREVEVVEPLSRVAPALQPREVKRTDALDLDRVPSLGEAAVHADEGMLRRPIAMRHLNSREPARTDCSVLLLKEVEWQVLESPL